MSARSFWPPVDAAQVDYETLRANVLEQSRLPESLAAARFARRGLAGLIAWPSAEPVFVAELIAAARPAWTPHDDPRPAQLAGGRVATSLTSPHRSWATGAADRRSADSSAPAPLPSPSSPPLGYPAPARYAAVCNHR